ncbi:polysaccharide biosynthesis/export family protein [Azospirillum sp. TSO5]|jgi:polysaccharide export outer membrane protein|uniref:polysaccharide biosynthesis/export family protein n=1 Tax=Azospirillum sp. TSO5 TaxID=716760 RepID=UPI000D610F1C|nr:polysaccharide biosynthesis/export family protein [Azospirillum sp. TSO5]PWC97431.1 sugar ABC transporter substrate-binding protein [Azospirillum sp. TSO5]
MNQLSRRVGASLLTMLLLSACGSLSSTVGDFPSEPAPAKIANPAEGYLLEPGNRVRVIVFNESNLSGDFTVDPAGNIAMPLVGNIAASGVTAKALSKRIEDALKRDNYMQVPSVAVEVQTFRPYYVLGEVRQPGEFPYTTGMTVLSAVARAGGYDYRARQGEVVLVRPADNGEKEYRATERTPLLPGDIVKVLERRF